MRSFLSYAWHHARAAARDVAHPAVLAGAALLVAVLIAQPGITRTAPDLVPTPAGTASWWIGPSPIDERRAQRFTRRADPAQRAAVARIITEEAQAAGVPVAVALAVAHVESGMRPAHIVTGPPTRYGRAVGTMQVLPSTGRAMGCGNLRDTRQNVRCGVRYLARSLARNGGDVGTAALEYHGGPNRRIWGPRTHRYRQMVLARAGIRHAPVAGRLSASSAGNDHFMQWWLSR